jgi:DNA-binding winged helix-turn-helix (wHTH) protein/Tfp pilus assembly protein PilF
MAGQYLLLDLAIDLRTRRVQRADCTLEVTGLSFDLLACLIVRGNAVVSFDELMAAVWAPAIVNEDTVTQRVRLLRRALGDDGRTPRYIRSVRGQGYQLVAEPQLVVDNRQAAVRARLPLGAAALAMGVILVLSASLIWLWLASRPAAEPAAAESPVAEPGTELLERARYYASIGQKDNNERAITLYQQALLEKPTLTAAALGLSFAYSARVCLYDFAPMWLDRAASLARGVLRSEPRNALAYTALAYSEDCRGYIDAAISDYERALHLDPGDRHDSLASLANLYQVKGRLVEALRSNLQLSQNGERSRYLDIQTARTLELLGFTAEAERLYAHSFRINPDNLFSNVAWPRFLMTHGRLAEANTALDEALARGTDRNDLQLLAGELALQRGDRQAALSSFNLARMMRPYSSFAASMALLYAEPSPSPATLRGRIAAVQRSIDAGDRWPINWLEVAVLQTALGDRPAALAALRHAIDAGFLDRACLEASPFFQPLRTEPGFAQVLTTITQRIDEQRAVVLTSICPGPYGSALSTKSRKISFDCGWAKLLL